MERAVPAQKQCRDPVSATEEGKPAPNINQYLLAHWVTLVPKESRAYLLQPRTARSYSVNEPTLMADAVKLPARAGLGEWTLSHLARFAEELSFIYRMLGGLDICKKDCPCMRIGQATHAWPDGPFAPPAARDDRPPTPQEYVAVLEEQVRGLLADPVVTAPDTGDGQALNAYAEQHMAEMQTLLRRMSRAFGHAVLHHQDETDRIDGCSGSIDGKFVRYIFFVREFGHVKGRDLAPLEDAIRKRIEGKTWSTFEYVIEDKRDDCHGPPHRENRN